MPQVVAQLAVTGLGECNAIDAQGLPRYGGEGACAPFPRRLPESPRRPNRDQHQGGIALAQRAAARRTAAPGPDGRSRCDTFTSVGSLK